MILVPVRQEDATHSAGVLRKISNIGDHKVNAGHFLIREGDAGINDNNVFTVLDSAHIFADLPKSAKEDNAKLVTGLGRFFAVCGSLSFFFREAISLLSLSRSLTKTALSFFSSLQLSFLPP